MKIHQHDKQRQSKPIYHCVMCPNLLFDDRQSVLAHYAEAHEVSIDRRTFECKSYGEFLTWKSSLEEREKCYFIASSGLNRTPNKIIRRFKCFRDGTFSSKGKGMRRPKKKGSCKIGGVCPAGISLSEDRHTGVTRVTYVGTHVGHDTDMGKLNFSVDETAPELAENENGSPPISESQNNHPPSIFNDLLNLQPSSHGFNPEKAREELKLEFSELVQQVTSRLHVDVLRKLLSSVQPTFKVIDAELAFKSPRSPQKVNRCANESPQKFSRTTDKTRKPCSASSKPKSAECNDIALGLLLAQGENQPPCMVSEYYQEVKETDLITEIITEHSEMFEDNL